MGVKAETHENILSNFNLEQQNQRHIPFDGVWYCFTAMSSDYKLHDMPSLIHGILAVARSFLIWAEYHYGWATIFIFRIDDPASD